MNREVLNKAKETVKLLKEKQLKIASAESCTGGLVSAAITSVSGVSDIFEMGITTYSCRIKNKALGVKDETLEKFGAVSKETAMEMATSVKQLSDADIGVSVTGVAGPSGSEGHPAGYVFIAAAYKDDVTVKLLTIEPKGRNFVRNSAVIQLFELVKDILNEAY